jgi:hypothetical protein
MNPNSKKNALQQFAERPLKLLSPFQAKQIDSVLSGLGESGEVRLIKSKGRLRFITVIEDEQEFEPEGTIDPTFVG